MNTGVLGTHCSNGEKKQDKVLPPSSLRMEAADAPGVGKAHVGLAVWAYQARSRSLTWHMGSVAKWFSLQISRVFQLGRGGNQIKHDLVFFFNFCKT